MVKTAVDYWQVCFTQPSEAVLIHLHVSYLTHCHYYYSWLIAFGHREDGWEDLFYLRHMLYSDVCQMTGDALCTGDIQKWK